MARKIKKRKVRSKSIKRVINSYILAQEEPLDKLRLLQRYLQKKGIADISLKELKTEVKRQMAKDRKDENLSRMEAKLFTRSGESREYKYGSAFCGNCNMYKDYKKECPYCGDLEMTL